MIDGYKGSALISMFDCIANLAQVLGEDIRDTKIIEVLMPLLSKKWVVFNDDDRKLLPLFECFETVINSVGREMIAPYV